MPGYRHSVRKFPGRAGPLWFLRIVCRGTGTASASSRGGFCVRVGVHSGVMKEQRHSRLGAFAAEQYGVFSRRAARELNFPDSTITDGVAAGRYRRVEPGVYAISGSPESLRQRMAAAVMSLPALAAVSHATAAELWGLTDRGISRIEIVTTRWDRVRRNGVVVHESLDLIDDDVTQREGLAITTPVRTIVDLGATNRWIVESALEQGIRQGLFTILEVEALVSRVAKRGRRGVGVVRPLIETRRRWDTATESALEDEFRTLLADAGFPQPQPQYVLRDSRDTFVCRADFAYVDAQVLIELDSEAHHLDRLSFRRDRSKQNRAIVLGWTVLRYTWWDIQDDPYRVLDEVRTTLENSRSR